MGMRRDPMPGCAVVFGLIFTAVLPSAVHRSSAVARGRLRRVVSARGPTACD